MQRSPSLWFGQTTTFSLAASIASVVIGGVCSEFLASLNSLKNPGSRNISSSNNAPAGLSEPALRAGPGYGGTSTPQPQLDYRAISMAFVSRRTVTLISPG